VIRTFVFALAAALVTMPALAGEKAPVFVESSPVKDKPAIAFKSDRAYVMLRTDMAMPLYLIRVPNAADQAAYDKLRARALAEARGKYLKKLAKYERAKAQAAKSPGVVIPDEPEEPTEANFEFTPFALLAGFTMGPANRFAKGEGGASTYLQELTPGEYRIYGPTVIGPAGQMGICYCMGSVKFEARAGEIADMGVILSRNAVVPKAPPGDSSMPVIVAPENFLGPAPAGMALDPRLSGATIKRAAYKPVGKLPNYFGVTLGRIPEMPGVFRYERDRMIDLSAGD
jgi:hypothetical protein